MHPAQVLLVDALADDGNRAGTASEAAGGLQSAAVVGAVGGRLHDHHALEAERLLMRQQVLHSGDSRRVEAVRGEAGVVARAEDVHMAVAAPGR
ncbi:MAG TPA: hypothetical protein VIS03_18990 [Kiloniellaceae bacterium]